MNIALFPIGLDCGSMQLNPWDLGQEVQEYKAIKK